MIFEGRAWLERMVPSPYPLALAWWHPPTKECGTDSGFLYTVFYFKQHVIDLIPFKSESSRINSYGWIKQKKERNYNNNNNKRLTTNSNT